MGNLTAEELLKARNEFEKKYADLKNPIRERMKEIDIRLDEIRIETSAMEAERVRIEVERKRLKEQFQDIDRQCHHEMMKERLV